jgi:hypothetical protein
MRAFITATLSPEALKAIKNEDLGVLASEWRHAVGRMEGFSFSQVEVKFVAGLTRVDLRNFNLEVMIPDTEGTMRPGMSKRMTKDIVAVLDTAILTSQLTLPSGAHGVQVYLLPGSYGYVSI